MFKPGDRVRPVNGGSAGTVQLMRDGKVKVRWDHLGWPTQMVDPQDIRKACGSCRHIAHSQGTCRGFLLGQSETPRRCDCDEE